MKTKTQHNNRKRLPRVGRTYTADARLIASAPDLLEAAKLSYIVLDYLRNTQGDGFWERAMGPKAYEAILAAIAKAENRDS